MGLTTDAIMKPQVVYEIGVLIGMMAREIDQQEDIITDLRAKVKQLEVTTRGNDV